MAKNSTRGKATVTNAGKPGAKQPSDRKPNILVIWGDDIGISNLSCYSHGVMGYQTPNIDRIAQGRHDVHRLLRRAELHGGPLVVHHRAERLPHRPVEGRHSRRRRSACPKRS